MQFIYALPFAMLSGLAFFARCRRSSAMATLQVPGFGCANRIRGSAQLLLQEPISF